ncbi:MAG TPA: rod shape-determining protein MreC, partial [Planctomycetota bacterium]|nr:rod shape-determining protein MreC [Planctomycetota bacterium]
LLLVGRVARVHAGSSLVRVETLLDPAFRVRFQTRGASGILWGTGKRKDGKVVLDVHHLSELVDVEEGEPVFTHGGDGRFPPGILIGWTARKEGPEGAARFEVHGAIDPARLSRILLAEDTAASKLTALILEENSPEKRGRSTP